MGHDTASADRFDVAERHDDFAALGILTDRLTIFAGQAAFHRRRLDRLALFEASLANRSDRNTPGVGEKGLPRKAQTVALNKDVENVMEIETEGHLGGAVLRFSPYNISGLFPSGRDERELISVGRRER